MDPLKDAKHTACPQPRYQPYQMGRLFDLGPMCTVRTNSSIHETKNFNTQPFLSEKLHELSFCNFSERKGLLNPYEI